MNKLLVAVFDTEAAADAGLNALRSLHANADITLYATGVLVKDGQGAVSVRKPLHNEPVGTATGLAVGSLIGLLGGPAGMAIGAVTGGVVGAVRDFWVAGVGLDFIDEATRHLQPGKVALVAEIEEEWVVPVDAALEAAGGQVFRRTRSDMAQAQFDHDIVAFRTEIDALETEAAQAGGNAKTRLQAQLALAKTHLDGAVHRAQQRVGTLKLEADAKAEALKQQLAQAQGEAKARIEARMQQVKTAYHARGAKLAQAWSLTKQALSA